MGEMKDLKYYLELPYRIEIKPLTQDEGGGYSAILPQFGSMGIVGDGETIIEAIDDLEKIKKIVFERLLQNGETIPEPENDISQYSGKILTRMPKELHARLIKEAIENGASLNQYIIYLLSSRIDLPLREALRSIEKKIETCVNELPEKMYDKSTIFRGNTKHSFADGFDSAA